MSKDYQEEIKKRMRGHEITNDGRIVKIRRLGTTRADNFRGAKYAEEDYLTCEQVMNLLYNESFRCEHDFVEIQGLGTQCTKCEVWI